MDRPLFGKPKALIVDGNHTLHRQLLTPSLAVMKTSAGIPSGGIFGFLRTLRMSIKNLGSVSKIIVVFDSGNSARRRALFPGYRVRPERQDLFVPGKGLVPKDKLGPRDEGLEYYEVFGEQCRYVQDFLKGLCCNVVKLEGREGDDVIAKLVTADDEYHHVIMSDDRDFFQLISPDVHVYRGMVEEYWDERKFVAEHQFPLNRFLYYKALIGDDSDEVPGVKGCGPKTAATIVSTIKSPRELPEFCRSHKHKRFRDVAIPENLALIKRNLQLFNMKLEEFSPKEEKKIRQAWEQTRTPDWGTLRRVASELELASLSENLGRWASVFPMGKSE